MFKNFQGSIKNGALGCAVVAQDRNNKIVGRMAGRGRIKAEDIGAVIGDSTTNYKKFPLQIIEEYNSVVINT